ncbi:GNAT family N-acetyltransferase [Paenibacillus xylaniclasticus]|uniref:GNAT family N-acetyltransferase n=1 Tax=Paenibacillus xylaniclasticus TaxID=588083 RepID=UPI000FDB5FFF|nr:MULTISPECIES: GNAT family N-acetyltransferase [Paenibacillus]GFN29975.1 putative N-acetyltransferase YkwB [Paenibacillus curdlanolyticus]
MSIPYYKSFYVMNDGKPVPAVVRSYTEADFDELIQIQAECFPPPYPPEQWWNREQLASHIERFPEGALCIEVDGRLAGSMTGLIVQFDPAHPEHSWEEITDNGYIRNHDPSGDTLYVVDLCVRPQYRKLRLGQWLMFSMYDVVVHHRLTRLLGGGRLSGYHLVADRMSPEQYLDAVIRAELNDPVISFMLRVGRTPIGVVRNYLNDEESGNNAALMEWRNPFLHTKSQ